MQGTRDPVTGACGPPTCREAFVDLEMEIPGMPSLDGLHYVVTLTGGDADGPDPLLLGELAPSDGAHRIDVNRSDVDGRPYERIQVHIAPDPDPAGFPGPVLFDHAYGPLDGTAPPPVNLTNRTQVRVPVGWSCCGRGDRFRLELSNPRPYDGLTRCAWRVDGEGVPERRTEGLVLVADGPDLEGAFTAAGCNPDDTPWTGPRQDLYGTDVVLVTYEHAADAPPSGPGGFPTLQVRIFQST